MTPNEQAALWLELAARLPGLKCQDCGGSGKFIVTDEELFGSLVGLEAHCPQAVHWPNLALLLRAAREAGWRYEIFGFPEDYSTPVVVHLYSRHPTVRIVPGRGPDELTAAMLAMKRALDAEKERNHATN